MHADLAIPQTRSDITPGWLTEVMSRHYPGVVVEAAKVSEFLGHKPNKVRVQLTYKETGNNPSLPASVFVKGGFKGTNNAATSGIESGLDIGTEVELLAYEDLVPALDVNTPKVLFVKFDAKSYTGIVVLEDLSLSGATFLNGADSLDYAQAAAFVDALAKMHAPWMNSREIEAPDGKYGPSSSLAERTARLHAGYFDHMATTPRWGEYAVSPRGAALPRKFKDAARFAAGQAKLRDVHRACGRTIIHGDEHLGNLYLDADRRPGFFDWCARVEPWAISYTYFLIVTTDALDRRHWEQPLLKLYLERLNRYGATAPTFEEAWFIYRCSILYPALAWFINSAKWQPEAINTRNTVRGAIAMMDHDVFELLGV